MTDSINTPAPHTDDHDDAAQPDTTGSKLNGARTFAETAVSLAGNVKSAGSRVTQATRDRLSEPYRGRTGYLATHPDADREPEDEPVRQIPRKAVGAAAGGAAAAVALVWMMRRSKKRKAAREAED